MRCAALRSLAVFLFVVFVGVTSAGAEDISGTIAVTKTIFEDSQLVGDVTCTMIDGPCIDFGASHIKLRLNGFTMTGPGLPDNTPDPANPSAFCNATSGLPQADGIRILNQTHAQILGPRMVQKFRPHGIFIVGTSGVSTKSARMPRCQCVGNGNCSGPTSSYPGDKSCAVPALQPRSSGRSQPAA